MLDIQYRKFGKGRYTERYSYQIIVEGHHVGDLEFREGSLDTISYFEFTDNITEAFCIDSNITLDAGKKIISDFYEKSYGHVGNIEVDDCWTFADSLTLHQIPFSQINNLFFFFHDDEYNLAKLLV